MTELSDPLSRRQGLTSPASSAEAISEVGEAAQRLRDRILLLDRASYIDLEPRHLDPEHGGLVVCGKNAGARVRQLRHDGYQGFVGIDAAAYETASATADEPFSLPEGRLFGNSLNDVLQDQLDCGASVAMTPTRYIHPADADALRGLMRAGETIERSDVVLAVPVEITWLRDENLPQLNAVLKRISHPKALILGCQYNPLEAFSSAPKNLRQLTEEIPNLGLWRTDLAAFDCIAYGGLFAAIGAGGSLRHAVPHGEDPQSSNFPHYPSVLIPDLLRFSNADWLADRYANTTPPRCPCSVCDGSFLDRFNHLGTQARKSAHAHNAAAWNSWLPDLFEHPNLAGRQIWWKNRCKAAIDAHELENVRIRQPNAFKPRKALEAWATLPVSRSLSS